MSGKPKILLSANKNKQYYIEAVNECGGIACAEYCPVYSEEYDGLILCGGNDINPSLYGETLNGSVEVDDERDKAETELFRKFLSAGKPVMGICRGHQMINVLLGGSLCQHLDNAAFHTNGTDYYCVHEVESVKGSIIYDLYGEKFTVNSSHHQGIKKLGEGLKACLFSGDIIEGIVHESLPVFGMQFHPERMCFSERREDTVDGKAVIMHFVKMCSKGV